MGGKADLQPCPKPRTCYRSSATTIGGETVTWPAGKFQSGITWYTSNTSASALPCNLNLNGSLFVCNLTKLATNCPMDDGQVDNLLLYFF